MFHDPKFWLAVSFTLFVILMIKYAWPLIIRMIDGKVSQISQNLKDSERLKKQAEKLLKDAQKYHEDSAKQSEQLIKDAKSESDNIVKECEKAVSDEIEKKLASADERIKTSEARVVREMKEKVIESAILAIEDNIEKVIGDKDLDDANKNSINQISSKLVN